MATRHAGAESDVIYVKGAVEQVLDLCAGGLAPDGSVVALDRAAVADDAAGLAASGQRVLALALRTVAPGEQIDLAALDGLALAGLQAMEDPPRAEAITAVAACRQAGVAVKMITGDHAATAAAIAHRVGLADEARPPVVTGADLAACPDADLPALVEATAVFARVSAEQKLRIVEALQSRREIVAMTGDGVNDAPALRQADIGVAMGRSGTEVARESADVVLADDNFASIEAAVEEGRHTFDNVKKFIVWTLPTNIGEGLLIRTAIVAGTTLPILPVQILWINMTTAVLLGLTLAFERTEPGIMRRPPRRPDEPLLTSDVVKRILLVSALLLGAAYWLFEHELSRGIPVAQARTIAVNVFVAVELLYLFNCRSLTGRTRDLGFLSNRWLLGGVALMIGLQLALTYWPPMNELFETAPIDPSSWLKIAAAGIAAWIVVEIEKALRRRAAARTAERSGRKHHTTPLPE
jgi:cation-transporting ATPase F